MISTFGFEGADTAFHQGIVVRISSAAHRNDDAVGGQQLLVGSAGILPAAVRMMQQFPNSGLTLNQRQPQRLLDQRRFQVGLHRPAGDLAREDIQDQRQIQPTFNRINVADVGAPFLIRSLGAEWAVEPVGGDGGSP